jgi:hypothetical protein
MNTRVAIFCIVLVYHNLIISMLCMDTNNNSYKIRLKYYSVDWMTFVPGFN